MDREYIMVLTTTETEEEAEEISKTLVERELAACVQVYGPIKSTYSWGGEVTVSEEWMCFVTTKRTIFDSVESEIEEIHSYENPEIVALPVVEGSKEYLDWINDNVRE
ncbi:MAG: divalent-cation tolerance protein CutA [Thermoplasmata archaeon]